MIKNNGQRRMKAIKSKVPFIQLPNNLIRDPKINAVDFVLLFKLKQQTFLHNSDVIHLPNDALKFSILVSDNKTIKKSYENLYNHGYLLEPAELVRRKPVKFAVNPEKLSSPDQYTQLPIYTLQRLDKIKHVGFRLLYYYSSYINSTTASKLYAYPAIETTKTHLGVHKDTILQYNRILEKAKLIKIEKHKLEHNHTYDVNDRIEWNKYNNHYYIYMDKLMVPMSN